MTSLQPVGFEDSYRQVPWPSRLHHGSMALLAKASPSSPERVDGKLTNSSSVKVLILAAPDAALAPLCVSTSAYCATEPTPARKRTNRLKPDLYDTPSTPTPSRHGWLFLNEQRTPSIPNLGPSPLPPPPRHSPPRPQARHPTKEGVVGFDRSPHLHVPPHGPMGAHSIPPPGCFAVCPEWRDLPRRRDTHPR